MIRFTRTDSEHPDFRLLAAELEAELKIRDGDDYETLAQLNKIDFIPQALVIYENGNPIACGAIREYEHGVMEIKRMYVKMDCRGKGIASLVLEQLENWTLESSFKKCVLETGRNQPEAISLYLKKGYVQILNFGAYTHSANSVCFEKLLS